MLIGPVTQHRLPQQDRRMVELMLDRYERAASPHAKWAEEAKKAIKYFEGDQWTEEAKAILREEGRPALTFNVIKPLAKIVLGYHRNNKTDIKFLPGNDGSGIESIAEALSQTIKHVSDVTDMKYVDTEVFMEGFLTGRAFYDLRLDFEKNDLGEISATSGDPFSHYIDPDADGYDPRTWRYIFESRWLSLDEILAMYGKEAAAYASTVMGGNAWSSLPTSSHGWTPDIRPPTRFAMDEDDFDGPYGRFEDRMYDFVDPARKTCRILDSQHTVMVETPVFVDLETGRRVIVPEWLSRDRIQQIVAYNEAQQNPVRLVTRTMKRIRWTTLLGDMIVWDGWSPFRSYTKVPFFPYFRRGKTRGFVDDLIDPQDLINKQSSANLNHVMRASNSGWMIEEGSMLPDEEENLEQMGGKAGIIVKYKLDKASNKPEQIMPPVPPTAHERMEGKAIEMLRTISGINESATGESENVVSGRAIEARQRQSILGAESDLDNYSRTQTIKGRVMLELVQDFYTEPRILRILGEDGRLATVMINQRDGVTGEITNALGVGTYSVKVDETPASASFLQATFNELLEMREKGVPIPDDMLVDASSFARKDELKQRMTAAAEAAAQAGNVDMAGNLIQPAPAAAPAPRGRVA